VGFGVVVTLWYKIKKFWNCDVYFCLSVGVISGEVSCDQPLMAAIFNVDN